MVSSVLPENWKASPLDSNIDARFKLIVPIPIAIRKSGRPEILAFLIFILFMAVLIEITMSNAAKTSKATPWKLSPLNIFKLAS